MKGPLCIAILVMSKGKIVIMKKLEALNLTPSVVLCNAVFGGNEANYCNNPIMYEVCCHPTMITLEHLIGNILLTCSCLAAPADQEEQHPSLASKVWSGDPV